MEEIRRLFLALLSFFNASIQLMQQLFLAHEVVLLLGKIGSYFHGLDIGMLLVLPEERSFCNV